MQTKDSIWQITFFDLKWKNDATPLRLTDNWSQDNSFPTFSSPLMWDDSWWKEYNDSKVNSDVTD